MLYQLGTVSFELDVATIAADEILKFSKTFAPQGPSEVDLLKIILDVFGLSYGLIGAGVWNKVSSRGTLVNESLNRLT